MQQKGGVRPAVLYSLTWQRSTCPRRDMAFACNLLCTDFLSDVQLLLLGRCTYLLREILHLLNRFSAAKARKWSEGAEGDNFASWGVHHYRKAVFFLHCRGHSRNSATPNVYDTRSILLRPRVLQKAEGLPLTCIKKQWGN